VASTANSGEESLMLIVSSTGPPRVEGGSAKRKERRKTALYLLVPDSTSAVYIPCLILFSVGQI